REWRPLSPRMTRYPPLRVGDPRLVGLGPPVRYEVTLEPSNRPWLLTLDAAVHAPQVAGMDTAMNGELQWIASQPIVDLVRYRAESHVMFKHGPARKSLVLPEYTQLPPGYDPRTMELARRLKSENPDAGPAALVQAALRLLRTGGYTYTLSPGVYG